MSSSSQPQPEGAKAQVPQLSRVLDAQRDKPSTVAQGHKTLIDSLKRSFETSQQSVIRDVENTLKISADNKHDLELQLQEEKQRVIELTKKLDETKHNETTVKLASEKVNHGLTKIALDKSKYELGEAKRLVVHLAKDLEAAELDNRDVRRRRDKLSATVDAVNKGKSQVEAKLNLSRSESADVQQRLKAVEQRNVKLEADLKAATERASGVENELKAFKSRFKQITDLTTTVPTSPEQQPIVSDPTALALASEGQPIASQQISSAPDQDKEDTGEQRESEPRPDGSPARPQGPGPHLSSTVSDRESDLLHCKGVLDQVMDAKHWQSTRYFFRIMDSLAPASRDAKVGTMNLDSMKEKLAKGSYTSATSFKADFDDMLTGVKTMNPLQTPVRIAAEQLSKIFDQAFSSQPISGHQPQETAQLAEATNGNKRKAANDTPDLTEEGQAQKRRSLAPTKQDSNQPKPVHSGFGGGPKFARPASVRPKDNSNDPTQTNRHRVVRQLSTDISIDIHAELSADAQLVSFIKSPSTLTGTWKSLVPHEFELIDYVSHTKVEDHISMLVQTCKRDVIVLRLTPSDKTNKPKFNRILEHLVEKRRHARVSHLGSKDVEDMYLIPVPMGSNCYPTFFTTLDVDLLPPIKTENLLLMAVVFKVAADKQKLVREAWNNRMWAIQKGDFDAYGVMRDALTRNPLHIFSARRTVVSSADRHLAALGKVPDTLQIQSEEVLKYGQSILRLSYCKLLSRPSTAGVLAPEWVFVLGAVVLKDVSKGTLVVDIQHQNRPLWLIGLPTENLSGRTLTLLASKFPGCWTEWMDTIPELGGLPNQGGNCLKNTGLKMECTKVINGLLQSK